MRALGRGVGLGLGIGMRHRHGAYERILTLNKEIVGELGASRLRRQCEKGMR